MTKLIKGCELANSYLAAVCEAIISGIWKNPSPLVILVV